MFNANFSSISCSYIVAWTHFIN